MKKLSITGANLTCIYGRAFIASSFDVITHKKLKIWNIFVQNQILEEQILGQNGPYYAE